jgi:hypothetical protein
VVKQTLEGAIRTLTRRTHERRRRRAEQVAAEARCARTPTAPTTEAVDDIATRPADGTLLRGEVLARWQEFVGTGELLQALETRSAGCATGSSTRSRASRSRPSGSPSPSSPGWRR